MASVFLSYPFRDRAVARQFEAEFERLGLPTFNPANEIKKGVSWRKATQRAIR